MSSSGLISVLHTYAYLAWRGQVFRTFPSRSLALLPRLSIDFIYKFLSVDRVHSKQHNLFPLRYDNRFFHADSVSMLLKPSAMN